MKYDEIKINLRRKVAISTFIAQMDIGVEKPAGVFAPIIELAMEHNKTLTSDHLTREFGFTIPMAKQALKRSMNMGLFELLSSYTDTYQLTKLGQEIASSNESKIYQKETGEYRIFLTDDPLIPQKVLTLQRVDKLYHTKNRNLKKDDKFDANSLKGIFQNVVIDSEEEKTELINSLNIQIEKCYPNVFQDKNRDLTVDVICKLTPAIFDIKLEINWQNKKSIISLNEYNQSFDFQDVFTDLLDQANLLGSWVQHDELLRIPFNPMSLKDVDYKQFKRKVSLNKPTIKHFGDFESTEFYVPVGPTDTSNCLEWEKSLFLDRINSILFNEDYTKLANNIEFNMQKTGKIMVNLPPPVQFTKELLEKSRNKSDSRNIYGPRPDKYWFIQAGMDLN